MPPPAGKWKSVRHPCSYVCTSSVAGEYWRKALANGHFDEKLADKACAIAAACSPYCHPRLHAIDAKIETALVVMTEDERRAQARQAIAEAFAERPLKLIEGEVIEADAAETLASASPK